MKYPTLGMNPLAAPIVTSSFQHHVLLLKWHEKVQVLLLKTHEISHTRQSPSAAPIVTSSALIEGA